MLITHSTGGIIALNRIADNFIDINEGNNLTDDKISIRSLMAWATPINGLRLWVRIGGKVMKITGYSPETIPDLSPNSLFLHDLKKKLKKLGQPSSSSFTEIKKIHVTFYQGQAKDNVVIGIDKKANKDEGWLWDWAKVVNTDQGHMYNLSDSGEVGLPKYPAHVVDQSALLILSFNPRYDDIFQESLKTFSQTLECQQIQIINALAYYGKSHPLEVLDKSIGFFDKIMNSKKFKIRSSKVDYAISEKLILLIKEGLNDKNKIKFLIQLVRGPLRNYSPEGGEDSTKFGHNHRKTVLNILKLARDIHETILNYLGGLSLEGQNNILRKFYRKKILNAPLIDQFKEEISQILVGSYTQTMVLFSGKQ